MKRKIVAPKELIPYLNEMLYELQTQKFEAFQVPDTDKSAINGHNIWVAETHNPKWYSELIRKYPKKRNTYWRKSWRRVGNADSVIVRKDIERILTRLANEQSSTSIYADDLLEIAEDKLKKNEEPLTKAEIYFWECHKLLLDNEEIKLVEKIPEEFWSLIATHLEKHKQLPKWVSNFKDAPF